ncbi:MAG: DUF1015 domain-containing protein [Bdellovibrionota bacterium]
MKKNLAVKPFSGVRFSSDQSMCKLICPPYDVVDQHQYDILASYSSHNAIHLTLNDPKCMDAKKKREEEDYLQVKRFWDQWNKENILNVDPLEHFYLTKEFFHRDGQKYMRKVLYALVNIDPDRGGPKIIPHEKVLELPIQDRLRLLEVTKVQTSPIYLVFDDQKAELDDLLSSMGQSPLYACDHPQVQSQSYEFYSFSDDKSLSSISDVLSRGSFLVADGHHRLETTRRYFRKEENQHQTPYVFAAIVSSIDPGVLLSSIHRGLDVSYLSSSWFDDLHVAFDFKPMSKTWEAFEQSGALLAIDQKNREELLGMYPKQKGLEHLPEIEQTVPSSVLNHIVFEDYFSLDLDRSEDQKKINYINNIPDLQTFVDQKSSHVGFWLRPLLFDQIKAICSKGIILPQKSTFFYPKIMSGFVFHRMEDSKDS